MPIEEAAGEGVRTGGTGCPLDEPGGLVRVISHMNLETELYSVQSADWPTEGRVILAQYDDDSIVVYQAYRPAIGNFRRQAWLLRRPVQAVADVVDQAQLSVDGCTGAVGLGSKVKKSCWPFASSVRRSTRFYGKLSTRPFDLRVTSHARRGKRRPPRRTFGCSGDPDHAPDGAKLERRAIQLGLRGEVLAEYAREWIVDITDISEFVRAQRDNSVPTRYDQLAMPRERVYPVTDQATIRRLRLEFAS